MKYLISFNKNNVIKIVLAVVLLFFVICVLYLVQIYGFDLSDIQSLFSIIGSFSLGIALVTYIEKKNRDELISIIDQITFFRKEIIVNWDEVKKSIKEKYSGYVFSRIGLENLDIDIIRNKYPVNFKRQQDIFIDVSKNYPDIEFNEIILTKQTLLLNMIEEFCLKAKYLQIIENDAMKPIHHAFIEIIENNAVALLFIRDVSTNNMTIYSSILEVYNSWKNKTVKPTFIFKNLEKHKFVTKKQVNDFYKMRNNKVGF